MPFHLLAQAPPGLEPLLLAELRALGIQGQPLGGGGGVAWKGDWESLAAANLHLRTASRVLVEVGRFRARALGELARKAGDLPWERVLAAHEAGAPVRFRVSSSRSRLYHEGAIEERLRGGAGLGPAAEDPAGPRTLVVVRVHRDEVTIRLDTSGEHLHRRGYRLHVGQAPLRETLAAALLLAEEAEGNHALLDPFCGSGTIPIEAALLARRIPPGLAQVDEAGTRVPRDFAFLQWPDFPAAVWEAAVTLAFQGILPAAPAPLLGSDRDESVLEAARANAHRAGVASDVAWARASLSRAPVPPLPARVVTNPPYGTRLGERRRLRALYGALGAAIRTGGRLHGASLLYLSGDPVLDQTTGLPLEPRFATTHGGLRVQAMGVKRAAPESDEISAGAPAPP
jgi:putative N6-adenine-specific DNA methylase